MPTCRERAIVDDGDRGKGVAAKIERAVQQIDRAGGGVGHGELDDSVVARRCQRAIVDERGSAVAVEVRTVPGKDE